MTDAVTASESSHSAVGPALGYYYQVLYALVLLLDAPDDSARVSIETRDDVVLERGETVSLHQLKHSTQSDPPRLSIKSDEVWTTMRAWSEQVRREPAASFILAASAELVQGDPIENLQPGKDRAGVLAALRAEAQRVKQAVQAHMDAGKPQRDIPFAKRHPGCEAFLQLPPIQQAHLIERTVVRPAVFTAKNVEEEVSRRLHNTVKNAHRLLLSRRLVEWFDREAVRALCKQRPSTIAKFEVLRRIVELIRELDEDNLPDEFGCQPLPGRWEDHLPRRARYQIRIVAGTDAHYQRAAREYWRASSQRQRWIEQDLSSAAELDRYDEHMVEEWLDRHGPMCSRCVSLPPHAKAAEGLKLLDWSHEDAPQQCQPIRSLWSRSYLVRGTYQILADVLRVGWHPEFKQLVGDDDE